MGIRDRPTSLRSPWQNGYAERLIGSIRRECLDHVIVFSERHLRHLLLSYMKYYNIARCERIYPWRRMRQYRALLRGQGTSIVDLYWAGCIINMSGFDLRQAQFVASASPECRDDRAGPQRHSPLFLPMRLT